MYLPHYLKLEGYPGEHCWYNTTGQYLYRLHVHDHFYRTLIDGQAYAKNRAFLYRKRYLKLFPAKECWELIAMNILDPLPQETTANILIIFITDHHTKLARNIPSSIITAPHVSSIIFDHWISHKGSPPFFSRTIVLSSWASPSWHFLPPSNYNASSPLHIIPKR